MTEQDREKAAQAEKGNRTDPTDLAKAGLTADGELSAAPQNTRWRQLLVVFLVSLVAFGALFFALPVLYDTDSYYHLAIGRVYAQHGLIDALPWARLSLMFEGFGDKEPLFHLLLVPFSLLGTAGGRLALAVLNASLFTLLTALGWRLLGRLGILVPLLVYLGSLDFFGRAIRLRPEQLSLLLLLLLVPAAAARRWRTVAVLAFLYTLAYTAFHALLGLAFFFFCYELWQERKFDWKALLYPGLGCALGLLLHPQFPHNLLIWKVQSLDFFRFKAILDVGNEIAAAPADRLLLQNWPWLLGLVILWRAAVPAGGLQNEGDVRLADFLRITAAVFGLLFVLMQRFSTYAIPFIALWLVAEIGRRGLRVGDRLRLPWRGSVPIFLGLLVVLLPGSGRSLWQLHGMSQEGGPVGREQEWAEFGRAVPRGAKVAAEWGLTHVYLYFAPQASYLNVLDPVFMALPYPRAYEAQRALFDGRESDPALTVKAELDSDFLAFSRFHRAPKLIERLAGDPRFTTVYQGYNLLYRLEPNKNQAFLLDWHLVPPGTTLPVQSETTIDGFPLYPRREKADERALEAFVDLRRISTNDPKGCAALVSRQHHLLPLKGALELSPAGPTRLWIDEKPVVAVENDLEALLGKGVIVPLDLPAGSHQITVLTCPPRDAKNTEGGGFYLRLR